MVELNQQVNIAVSVLLASCIGTKNPCLHDGLRLEVINDLLGYCLISHRPNWSLSVCKDSKRFWNSKEIEEKYGNMAKSKNFFRGVVFENVISDVNYMI